jgi:hypothetical protein
VHLARLGCLLAFALPFVGGGLAALVSAGARIASGQREGEAVVAGSVGLLFTLAGGGLLALGVHGSRRQREADRLRAAHPAEPWRWRPDWAAGRVTDSSRAGLAIAWGFAGFWNLLSWPAVAAALTETDGPPLLLIALFPLVGLGLLVWAGRLTIRYRTFGTSVLEFGDMPGVIGRGFRGVVRVQGSPPAPRFDALLRRIERRTSGSGRSRTTTESIAWEERTAVTPRREAGGVVVPVAFRIPASEPPTDADPSANPRTLWRLELAADVPGVDYHARFDVPVFEVPGSAPLDDASLPPLPDAPSPAAYRQPRESPITLSTTARGTEIFFPRARNPGMAAALTGFAALWWGIVAVLLRIAAPLLFPVVFGAFGVVLAAAIRFPSRRTIRTS